MNGEWITVDGNEAVASVAHRLSEVIAIYPITPSSSMGELCDEWSSKGRTNLWGVVPQIQEMQSEAGAAGCVHGALQAGALATTFTASQGLLLMIPDMYKIAGELTAYCMHVAARTLATHALSIFGDHSDVMACRGTGFGMLASASVQEAADLALIATAASLRCRVPFLHFFDGFRTSHEVARIRPLADPTLRALVRDEDVAAHRARALSPDHPVVRGTAANPDTFFQAREAINPWYAATPAIVQGVMDEFASLTGRAYRLFEYAGHPQAERVVLLMGSGGETVEQTARWLADRGERVGALRVRLYRPFDADALLAALPPTVSRIAVLDRTKEPGAPGEPLYLDVLGAVAEARAEGRLDHEIRVIGGRYGLASKEFTPGMVAAVYAALAEARPKNHFTVGIVDDVSGTSLPWDAELDILPKGTQSAVFFGLGSDGTVGANKNSIKILGERMNAQGYFVYDSKKSGAITISHLRYGPEAIRAPYLVRRAGFVGVHQPGFLDRYDVLSYAAPGATLLLNTSWPVERVWDSLPRECQQQALKLGIRIFALDAYRVAREAGLGNRINTIMQTAWFALTGVLPMEDAIGAIKAAIDKTYARRGPEVLARNHAAVDAALAGLHEVPLPGVVTATRARPPVVSSRAPDFVQRVTALMLSDQGDLLPVSAFPVDGTWPTDTARWEKRNLAREIPIWDPAICIQCNKCAMVCPHAAIRVKAYPPEALEGAPEGFPSIASKGVRELDGQRYTVQVAPEDCTGCSVCVAVCPAKDRSNPRHKSIDMAPQAEHLEVERQRWDFFLGLPEVDASKLKIDLRTAQLKQPLFEFSGACSGCGETPYIKLLTQLVGDHLLIANATGCSSIYGGNLPTTPYAVNRDGRGPAWANSLFEDNAEFGLGFRLAVDQHAELAAALLRRLAPALGDQRVAGLLESEQGDQAGVEAQRLRVADLKAALAGIEGFEARQLEQVADGLVRKSVWLVGGDGWAYDIGYGGLDHVLSTGRDVNVLVLDTEVYSNTGGQQSKATPRGASAKFAVAGKAAAKKDLGLMAMAYGNVYVARVAFGARDAQTVKALQEAESYPGPSLVIAYSHCIAHGYDLSAGLQQQKSAVDTGYWPLYRYDPRARERGEAPLHLDAGEPRGDLAQFMRAETRFRAAEAMDPDRFREALSTSRKEIAERWALYQALATPKSTQA